MNWEWFGWIIGILVVVWFIFEMLRAPVEPFDKNLSDLDDTAWDSIKDELERQTWDAAYMRRKVRAGGQDDR